MVGPLRGAPLCRARALSPPPPRGSANSSEHFPGSSPGCFRELRAALFVPDDLAKMIFFETYARAIPMMKPRVIAEEIADLWIGGENGEIRARTQTDLPAQRIDEPQLEGWGAG